MLPKGKGRDVTPGAQSKPPGQAAAKPAASSARAPLYRIFAIHREISLGGFPNSERLGRMLEVSSKTVRRDIEFMKFQLGFPVEYDAKRKGFYYAPENGSGGTGYWENVFARSFSGEGGADGAIPARVAFGSGSGCLPEMLERMYSLLSVSGVIFCKRPGRAAVEARPLALFRERGAWHIFLEGVQNGLFVRAPLSKCSLTPDGFLSAADSDIDELRPSAPLGGGCWKGVFRAEPEACMCSSGGRIRMCTGCGVSVDIPPPRLGRGEARVKF